MIDLLTTMNCQVHRDERDGKTRRYWRFRLVPLTYCLELIHYAYCPRPNRVRKFHATAEWLHDEYPPERAMSDVSNRILLKDVPWDVELEKLAVVAMHARIKHAYRPATIQEMTDPAGAKHQLKPGEPHAEKTR